MDQLQNNPAYAGGVFFVVIAAIAAIVIYATKPEYAMADDSTLDAPKFKPAVMAGMPLGLGALFGVVVYFVMEKRKGGMAAGFRFAMESCGCGY